MVGIDEGQNLSGGRLRRMIAKLADRESRKTQDAGACRSSDCGGIVVRAVVRNDDLEQMLGIVVRRIVARQRPSR